jgi:flagellar basal body-associated protein FliL
MISTCFAPNIERKKKTLRSQSEQGMDHRKIIPLVIASIFFLVAIAGIAIYKAKQAPEADQNASTPSNPVRRSIDDLPQPSPTRPPPRILDR